MTRDDGHPSASKRRPSPDEGAPSEALVRRALETHERAQTESVDGPARGVDYLACIAELHRRGSRLEFELARDLIEEGGVATLVACNVLAQLGTRERRPDGAWPFRDESVPLVAPLLDHENADIRAAAVSALGWLGMEGVESRVLALAEDSSEDVRFSVACALQARDDDESLRTLVRLSADPDDDVRDWATFGLGSQTERDEPWIRDALVARLDDSCVDAA